MDHAQLINELPAIQQMSAEQRLYHARQRRIQQLEYWKRWEASNEAIKDVNYIEDRKYLNKKEDIKYADDVLLLDATQRNDLKEVRHLLISGVPADIKNHDGFTAVHQSSIDGNDEMLKLLLDFGADVNCRDDDGWTPLHAAAACRRRTIVCTLIDYGADMLALNTELTFPYDMTDDFDILSIFDRELSKRGINKQTMSELRSTPESQYLTLLQNGGIDDSAVILQRIDSSNATHLHFAAAYNFCAAAKYLLQLGIAVDSLDNKH